MRSTSILKCKLTTGLDFESLCMSTDLFKGDQHAGTRRFSPALEKTNWKPFWMFLPVCKVVVVIVRQALPQKVAVTQVTGLEVISIQAFDARGAAEVAAGGHGVGRELGTGLAALVPPRGRRSVARLESRAGLAVAPGEGRGAVGQTGHAASVGLVTVVAHVAAVQTAGERRGKGSLRVTFLEIWDVPPTCQKKQTQGGRPHRAKTFFTCMSDLFREAHSGTESLMTQIEQLCWIIFWGFKLTMQLLGSL